jgi:aspartate carbamoyltransferase catalytic subunit
MLETHQEVEVPGVRTKGIPEEKTDLKPRSLLGIEHMEKSEIESYLELAQNMDPGEPSDRLRGKKVILLFYENSTRTRSSFEIASKVQGATTTLITAVSSSIEKGESLMDTGYTVTSLGADAIVMRHPSSGAHVALSRWIDVPLINAGDGMHEHPSQALLDAFTMLQHKPSLKGLRVLITGDILHSRVARSDAFLLSKFGAEVTFCGPPDLVPDIATTLAPGVRVMRNFEQALRGQDVVMMLRIQKERFIGKRISLERYIADYQLTMDRLKLAEADAILMHPGPIIRGLELTAEVADCPQSRIRDQVRNGVRVRMGVMARALGKL